MIRKATASDLYAVSALAEQLWSGHADGELVGEMEALLRNENCAVFLFCNDEVPVGFAQCQLRSDYVEGTESSPVGYLEGIYVAASYRHKGIARALLQACEGWARLQGCREFASDCELENTDSLLFHLNVGFTEANRVICFTKQL